MSIEAMKLALEYLESEVPFYECEGNDPPTGMTESIKALRSAIEQAEEQRPHYTWQYAKDYIASRQAEQEPVAWMYEFGTDCGDAVHEIRWYSNVHWKKPSGLVRNVVPLYTAPPQREWQPKGKLWLWKNFVDGKPEYWAFDNPYPKNLANADPQTLGEPCGYAIFKQSRDGSDGRTEEQVLKQVKSALAHQRQRECAGTAHDRREWQGLTDEEKRIAYVMYEVMGAVGYTHAIEEKLKEKNT